jgi:signal peptide peptidase SppA
MTTAARYPHLAARLFNAPLLIHPQKLDAIVAGLGPRLLGGDLAQQPAAAPQPGLFSTRRGAAAERGYRIVDGVAVLSINGALVHRSQFLAADSTYLLGYDDLAADLEDAMQHPDVHAVLQVYESPGGEANGAFEFAQRVHDLRGRKPLHAIADGMAASAAYLSASAADQLAVSGTGYAGSIGVVARHVDFSRALANEGVAITHIFAGAHKVDGNPYEPLPETVRRQWQADIDGLYADFVAAVARHRGLSPDAVRATQAQTFRGAEAVAHGLADRVATTDQLIAELSAQRARTYPAGPAAQAHSTTADKGAHMSGTSVAGAPAPAATATPAVPAATFSQADLDAAREAGRAEGHDQGATAERTRVQAIFALPAAAAQPALAQQCVATGLTAEQATAILGAAPTAPAAPAAAAPAAPAPTAAAPANPFATHMAALGNPAVTGLEGAKPDDAAAQLAAQVIASHRATR